MKVSELLRPKNHLNRKMTKAQWKEKNRAARICRSSTHFMYYYSEEPIPEALQPYLAREQEYPYNPKNYWYEKGNPKSYENIRLCMKQNVSGYSY